MSDLDSQLSRLAVIKLLVTTLVDTGKTRLQKITYFLQEAVGVPLQYSFRMHHYGPYSEELDRDLSVASSLGFVEVVPDADGFGYHVTSSGPEEDQMVVDIRKYEDDIRRTAATLEPLETSELELYATVHFVGRLDQRLSREMVVTTVRTLKPKFTVQEIDVSYESLVDAGLINS